MTQSCQVCNHDDRLAIDKKLISNISLASLSRQYGMSKASLRNHRKNHLSRQLLVSQKNRDIFTGETLMSLIQGWLTTSERILKECEQNKKYNTALKAMAQGRATAQFFFEVSVKLQEIKADEQRQEQEQEQFNSGFNVDNLTLVELKTFKKLHLKLMGKQQGRRTDLEKITRARIAQDKHRRKKLAAERLNSDNPVEPVKRKLKRRKVEPELIDEFDAMRDRLGISNQPELPKQRQWTDPY